MTGKENIKRNLGYWLHVKGVAQKELADKLEVNQSTVSHWISGRSVPDVETLYSICKVLKIDISDLFGSYFKEDDIELIELYRKKPHMQKTVRLLLELCD